MFGVKNCGSTSRRVRDSEEIKYLGAVLDSKGKWDIEKGRVLGKIASNGINIRVAKYQILRSKYQSRYITR
jgi:hypothetical protein